MGTPPAKPQSDPAPMMDVPKGGARVPMSIDECGATNPAGLSDTDVQKLVAGGQGALRILYPYDGTVFPRGILAPTVMWDGVTGAQYVYLHIESTLLEYRGCLAPTADGQLLLPDAVWELAGAQTEGNVDPYHVELSVMSGGTVTGPAAQTWTIAQATLKGSIYYNSYSSTLAGGTGGAVLRSRAARAQRLSWAWVAVPDATAVGHWWTHDRVAADRTWRRQRVELCSDTGRSG